MTHIASAINLIVSRGVNHRHLRASLVPVLNEAPRHEDVLE